MKQAVSAPPKAAPLAQFEIALKRFAPAMAQTDKGAVQAAEFAFGKGTDGDRVRFAIEGGKVLEVRFSVKSPVIKFFAELAKIKLGDKQE